MLSRLQTLLLLSGLLPNKGTFLFIYFRKSVFQGLHQSVILRAHIETKGLNTWNASYCNQNWDYAGKLSFIPSWITLKKKRPYHWVSLSLLKTRYALLLHKLRLNVMIMQKIFNGIKMFWKWKKSITNVRLSREIIYVFQNVFNYILNRLVILCNKKDREKMLHKVDEMQQFNKIIRSIISILLQLKAFVPMKPVIQLWFCHWLYRDEVQLPLV